VKRLWLRVLAGCGVASLFTLAAAGAVSAHVVEHAGPYTLEIGWQHEPTYVGESNGVQVIVTRADKPVTDLKADDLKAVVSTGDQQSGELSFEPGFDPEEMEGPLGEYDAAVMPTAPGDYTFHVTGSIHGTPIDITVTSGDATFDTVKGTTDIEFPTKLPTTAEIVTRLDRIDARIATPTATGPTQASVDDTTSQAATAQQAADRALLIGAALGLVGIVIGAAGVLVGIRAMRTARLAS
jgi:hypothetical protein